jgi:quercetin dioxygenase-like cupin family protein
VREPGDGKAIATMGITMTFMFVSEDTGGRYACYEYVAPPGFGGPPPHTHPGFDEAWYVLDGEVTLQVGERTVTATAGTFLHVPGATVHTFANRGAAPAKFLGLIIPGALSGTSTSCRRWWSSTAIPRRRR